MRTRAGRRRTTIGKATTEESAVKLDTDYETFIEEVPSLNPSWQHITDKICGVRIETIADATMQKNPLSRLIH